MAERRHTGEPASPGLAIGALAAPAAPSATASQPADSPTRERERLEHALAQARAGLERLAADNTGLGAEILTFQIELLDDPTLALSAFEGVDAGRGALAAWIACIEAHIADYTADDDPYFAARSSDLADLRDRVAAALVAAADETALLPGGTILLADDLTPSRFLAADWKRLGGVALRAGSPSSHLAMLARARGVPLVTGLGTIDALCEDAILDAGAGLLIVAPEPATRHTYAARQAAAQAVAAQDLMARAGPALTAKGEPVEVMVNVDDPDQVDDSVLACSDGVGLLRTEFLFIGRDALPDEETQYRAYVRLLERLGGRPCIVRTLDVGGDKPLPGVSLPAEANPFLGLRGLRLCLERPELFRPQIRALLRAAHGRPVRVMLPMVTVAAELVEAQVLFAQCLAELERAAVPAAMPPLGIMVETPAAALALDFLDADFYSIGSNDLAQYVMAAARDQGGRVGRLCDARHPAVQRLIEMVVRHGIAKGRPVSLCGDLASDPEGVKTLLGLGLRRLSVAPAALGRVKRAVAAFGAAEG